MALARGPATLAGRRGAAALALAAGLLLAACLAAACADKQTAAGCKRAEPKDVERTEVKSDPIADLMHEISRLKQELTPSEASVPSKHPAKPASKAAGQTVCDKSLAVATLGYRLLCHGPKLGAAHAPQARHSHQQEQQQQQQPKLQQGESQALADDAAALSSADGEQVATRERVDLLEPSAEAGELRRLEGLFERLNKRGDFRPMENSVELTML